jgi:hypothetical protein
MEYKLAALNYNQVSWNKFTEINFIHLLIQALNLAVYPMLDLRIRLTDAKNPGASMADILAIVARFPEFSTLTKQQKQLESTMPPGASSGSRAFVTSTPEPAFDDAFPDVTETGSASTYTDDSYDGVRILKYFKVNNRRHLFRNRWGQVIL